uniref:EG2771 n=1 Tax=Manihot esculenta TaxID=3983 RepID=U3GNZ2_MANES|nr:EG2771 [Manihot esculenta]
MATFSSLLISTTNSLTIPSQSLSLLLPNLHFQSHGVPYSFRHLTLKNSTKSKFPFSHVTKLRSVEEETQIPEEEEQQQAQEQEEEPVQEGPEQQTVSVPVSPSDILTMFFQAEGTMNETAIPTVTSALEETDGITNLKVQVLEGIASVELTKQTTVQATGVASSLVELIQGSGFKLQTLNLSFMDEEDVLV